MKNSLYVIAALLVIIWAMLYFGFTAFNFGSFNLVHLLLIAAGILVLVRIIFSKKLPGRSNRTF